PRAYAASNRRLADPGPAVRPARFASPSMHPPEGEAGLGCGPWCDQSTAAAPGCGPWCDQSTAAAPGCGPWCDQSTAAAPGCGPWCDQSTAAAPGCGPRPRGSRLPGLLSRACALCCFHQIRASDPPVLSADALDPP